MIWFQSVRLQVQTEKMEIMDDHGGEPPAAVTRQLPRCEVLSRPEALQAIRKEFDGVASMGTWDWSSVAKEADVKRRAIEKGETIQLADLLAICSEKHVELDPSFRQLKDAKGASMFQR